MNQPSTTDSRPGLKAAWKARVIALGREDGYVMIKQLASILQTGETKIRNDIRANRLGRLKMGPEETRCRVRIPVDEAIAYIDGFLDEPVAKPPIESSPLFRRPA